MLSELSRRRIRSINKLVRIGRNECVVVIRVDETKGKVWVFLFNAHPLHMANAKYCIILYFDPSQVI